MEQPHKTSRALGAANAVRKIYWRTFKPNRYGVKGLILHPDDPNTFLAIRQSYGADRPLTLPGGGYRPRKEEKEAALHREVHEEAGLELAEQIIELSNRVSRFEGKVDHITYFAAVALSSNIKPNREIADVRWTPVSLEGVNPTDVSNHIHHALQHYGRDNTAH